MMPVNKSCTSPIATWLSSKNGGNDHPHIICPIDTYISTIQKPRDINKRLFNTGVSLSLRLSSSGASGKLFIFFALLFLDVASYPALRTAAIISSEVAVPSTPIELVSRLTEHEVTPSTFKTAFSMRAAHAAQLIPVTAYCSIINFLPSIS